MGVTTRFAPNSSRNAPIAEMFAVSTSTDSNATTLLSMERGRAQRVRFAAAVNSGTPIAIYFEQCSNASNSSTSKAQCTKFFADANGTEAQSFAFSRAHSTVAVSVPK